MAKKQKSSDPSITLRITAKEKRELRAKAKKYANGNMSLWIRKSALEHRPRA